MLIMLDIYENNAYDIQQELKSTVSGAESGGADRLRAQYEPDQLRCLRQYQPEIVYHAAAHKHVPLMEDSPNEAIKNNVFGTYKTAMAADRYGHEDVSCMISTDKAVNPTNIMGASKRICEMIMQTFNRAL